MAATLRESYIQDPALECLSRDLLRQLQAERLAAMLHRLVDHSPFYKARLWAAGIEPGRFRGLGNLSDLPFTTKEDLRAHYPYGLLAVPRDQVARVHSSSGTTGRPTLSAYSRKDLDLWAELMARVLATAGVRAGTVVQIAYGYGMFTGGSGFQYGAERLGATVIPASNGNAEKQLVWMQELGSEVLLCTPSFAATLLQEIESREPGRKFPALKAGIFGGEFWSEALRARLENGLGIRALDTYGLSEVIGPGVAQECPHGGGMHLFEDHFLAEIVDPESGAPLPEGEYGELVLTSLTKEAMPILRYRTRDRTRLIDEPCPCGRSSRRIERVQGRADDRIKLGRSEVFLSEIEQVLLETDGVQANYQVVAADSMICDSPWTLRAQLVEDVFRHSGKASSIEAQVAAELRRRLGVEMRVTGVSADQLPRSEGKAKRLVYE